MKKQFKRSLSFCMTIVMLFSMIIAVPIQASAIGVGDVVSWMNSKNGTTINDGGTQCVAAFNSYLRLFGFSNPIGMYPVSGAKDIFDYGAPSGWQKIWGSGNYQAGDVVVWDGSVGRGWGHVGMVYSTENGVKIFDQNWVTKNVCGIHDLSATGAIRGVFRPPLDDNPFPGEEDTSWNVPVWKTANYQLNTYDSYGSQDSNRWIDAGDNCYIEKVYQNGYAWVKYPSSASSDGYRWAFTRAEGFSLDKKGDGFPGAEDASWKVPVWKTANYQLNTYDSNGSQESNRWIDQGDNCYIEKVYQNGYAWVKYPSSASSDGYRWAYTRAEGFSLEKNNWHSGLSAVNVGSDFYAYIINTQAWKHLTNDKDNVSMRTETGNANQVWKFDRQGDGSYKITNAYDGKVLDDYGAGTSDGTNVQVYSSNDTAAQRWYIYGESGAYILRAACGDLVLDINGGSTEDGTNVQMWTKNDTGAQKFQIWKLNKPGSTHINCNIGTSFTPTVFSWNATSDTTEYDLKIWKGTVWEGDAYKILWSEKGTSVSVNLPEGYYEAYVDSRNKYSITMSDNVVKFTVSHGTSYVFSDSFIASISKGDYCLGATEDGNVTLQTKYNGDNQKWKFELQEDNAYRITNIKYNKCLDVYNYDTANGTNVQIWTPNDSNAQFFYIRQDSDGYSLIPKCSLGSAVDITDNVIGNGTNIQEWSYQGDNKQIFDIEIEPSVSPGDINGDKKVNMKDLVLLQQYLNNWDVAINEKAANVNGDEKINMKDLVLLQQYLNGWEVELK